MLAAAQPARRRNLFVVGDACGQCRRQAICSLTKGFGLIGTIGQRLREIGKMNDETAASSSGSNRAG